MAKKKVGAWTTVTPLSKMLALVLFIAMPFIGFWIGYHFNKPPQLVYQSFTPKTEEMNFQDDAGIATNKFFQWYLGCLNDHFKSSSGKTPAQDCSYQNSQYVSAKLSRNISGRYGDPILCSQNTPASIRVDRSMTQGDKAFVVVHTSYQSSGDNPLIAWLELSDQDWKITNIECLH